MPVSFRERFPEIPDQGLCGENRDVFEWVYELQGFPCSELFAAAKGGFGL